MPAFGIIASTVLASIAMIINYLGSSGATVFTTLVLMTGITAAIPYGFSALAQIKWRWIDHRTHADAAVRPRHDRRGGLAGVLDPVHRLLAQHRAQLLGRTGRRSSWPAGALLLGIPVYLAQRRHMTEPARCLPTGDIGRITAARRPCQRPLLWSHTAARPGLRRRTARLARAERRRRCCRPRQSTERRA